MLAFLDSPGFGEILMVGLVALLLWGGNLPGKMREFGRTLSGLRKNVDDFKGEIHRQIESEIPPPSPSPPPPPEAPPEAPPKENPDPPPERGTV